MASLIAQFDPSFETYRRSKMASTSFRSMAQPSTQSCVNFNLIPNGSGPRVVIELDDSSDGERQDKKTEAATVATHLIQAPAVLHLPKRSKIRSSEVDRQERPIVSLEPPEPTAPGATHYRNFEDKTGSNPAMSHEVVLNNEQQAEATKKACLGHVFELFPDICREYVSNQYHSELAKGHVTADGLVLTLLDAEKPYPTEMEKRRDLKRKREELSAAGEKDMLDYSSRDRPPTLESKDARHA